MTRSPSTNSPERGQPCAIHCPPSRPRPEWYRRCGRLLGEQLQPQAKFVIGGDVQPATPACLAALAAGLCQAGVNVVDLGCLPTPMVYYARQRLQANGCAIATADGDGSEIHGLRWMIGGRPPTPADVAALAKGAARAGSRKPRKEAGVLRSLDISFDYVAWLQETWVDSLAVQRRVVIDAMHGTWARRARRYLQAIFPQSLFSAIHDEPQAAFDPVADAAPPDVLYDLANAVDHQRADLGIALDEDGDQVIFVDDEGLRLTAEEASCVLLESFAGEAAGQVFVGDIRFSRCVAERARQLAARPVSEHGSASAIRARMTAEGAIFGATTGGHYFFRALEGGDDALFAACWMIAWLGASGKSLSQLRRACRPAFITPELRVCVDPSQAAAILRQIHDSWSSGLKTLGDALAIDFPEGWALVEGEAGRSPLLFRFEASDWAALRNLVRHFCGVLGSVGDELWRQYTAALGHPGDGG